MTSRTEWQDICIQTVHSHELDYLIKFDKIYSDHNEGMLAIEDVHKLGKLRFFTPSGSLRSLIGSSAKVSKAVEDLSGVPSRIGQMFLAPDETAFLPVEEVFPVDGWRSGSANETRYFGHQDEKMKFGRYAPSHFSMTVLDRPKQRIVTMCRFRGKCRFTCLLKTGNIQMDSSARSRFLKTWFWLTEPICFLRLLLTEIKKHSLTSMNLGKQSYFRLNGMSDVFWENYIDVPTMKKHFKGFGGLYDYTKAPLKYRNVTPDYYKLVYSWDEKPKCEENARQYIQAGHSVAMVVSSVKKKKSSLINETIERYDNAVDGDLHDGRFADPPKAVVLLRNKGNLTVEKHLKLKKNGSQADLLTPDNTAVRFISSL